MDTARPLRSITQLVIVGIIVAGAIIFVLFMISIISNLTPQTVIEEVTIDSSSSGLCKVNTEDTTVPSKTIPGCDLPEGTKVTISYQQGLPFASIASP